MNLDVKIAVVPAAGLGTRFLPITKAIPKEMLPIVDKPTIQYIVEEAFDSGIDVIVLINGRQKGAIEDHFDHAFELEDMLRRRGRESDLASLSALTQKGHIVSVRQKEPLGLGHAVLCARPVIGDRPFAVLLGDDLIRRDGHHPPVTKQLIDAFAASGKAQVALMRVPRSEIHRYGAAEGESDPANPSRFFIRGLVEKPPLGTEKTDQAVVGRYVFPPSIWPFLEKQGCGTGGEVQLTDAMDRLRVAHGLEGCCFIGQRVDAGDKLGYLQANLLEALERPTLREPLLQLMRDLVQQAAR